LRAAGVNLFVSLEYFIETLIAYSTWVLARDHFVHTRFVYERSESLASIPQVLGRSVTAGSLEAVWNPRGGNTLGTLLAFAASLRTWLASLADRDRESLRRPTEDLPHFAEQPDKVFPFVHTQLWADSDRGALIEFEKGLREILTLVLEANAASVRNGLDHRRDEAEFPSHESMEGCVRKLATATERADAERYIPKRFWLSSVTDDQFGRSQLTLTDIAGREIIVNGPSQAVGLPALKFRETITVAAGNLLGLPGAPLTFHVKEASLYADYWEGYPRRRWIPPAENTTAVAGP
jgi:hypothetical protein